MSTETSENNVQGARWQLREICLRYVDEPRQDGVGIIPSLHGLSSLSPSSSIAVRITPFIVMTSPESSIAIDGGRATPSIASIRHPLLKMISKCTYSDPRLVAPTKQLLIHILKSKLDNNDCLAAAWISLGRIGRAHKGLSMSILTMALSFLSQTLTLKASSAGRLVASMTDNEKIVQVGAVVIAAAMLVIAVKQTACTESVTVIQYIMGCLLADNMTLRTSGIQAAAKLCYTSIPVSASRHYKETDAQTDTVEHPLYEALFSCCTAVLDVFINPCNDGEMTEGDGHSCVTRRKSASSQWFTRTESSTVIPISFLWSTPGALTCAEAAIKALCNMCVFGASSWWLKVEPILCSIIRWLVYLKNDYSTDVTSLSYYRGHLACCALVAHARLCQKISLDDGSAIRIAACSTLWRVSRLESLSPQICKIVIALCQVIASGIDDDSENDDAIITDSQAVILRVFSAWKLDDRLFSILPTACSAFAKFYVRNDKIPLGLLQGSFKKGSMMGIGTTRVCLSSDIVDTVRMSLTGVIGEYVPSPLSMSPSLFPHVPILPLTLSRSFLNLFGCLKEFEINSDDFSYPSIVTDAVNEFITVFTQTPLQSTLESLDSKDSWTVDVPRITTHDSTLSMSSLSLPLSRQLDVVLACPSVATNELWGLAICTILEGREKFFETNKKRKKSLFAIDDVSRSQRIRLDTEDHSKVDTDTTSQRRPGDSKSERRTNTQEESNFDAERDRARRAALPPCRFFFKSCCKYTAEECQFPHIGPTLKISELCRFLRQGHCDKGSSCPFSHDIASEPCRFHFLYGNCTEAEAMGLDRCRYSHEAMSDEVAARVAHRWKVDVKDLKSPTQKHNVKSIHRERDKDKDKDNDRDNIRDIDRTRDRGREDRDKNDRSRSSRESDREHGRDRDRDRHRDYRRSGERDRHHQTVSPPKKDYPSNTWSNPSYPTTQNTSYNVSLPWQNAPHQFQTPTPPDPNYDWNMLQTVQSLAGYGGFSTVSNDMATTSSVTGHLQPWFNSVETMPTLNVSSDSGTLVEALLRTLSQGNDLNPAILNQSTFLTNPMAPSHQYISENSQNMSQSGLMMSGNDYYEPLPPASNIGLNPHILPVVDPRLNRSKPSTTNSNATESERIASLRSSASIGSDSGISGATPHPPSSTHPTNSLTTTKGSGVVAGSTGTDTISNGLGFDFDFLSAELPPPMYS